MGALEFYKVEMYFVTKSNLLEVIVKNCMKLLEPVADHKLRLYRRNIRNFLVRRIFELSLTTEPTVSIC